LFAEICLEAVKQYGMALQHVEEQIREQASSFAEICVEVVKKTEKAVKFMSVDVLVMMYKRSEKLKDYEELGTHEEVGISWRGWRYGSDVFFFVVN
jgi:hypothetical protein